MRKYFFGFIMLFAITSYSEVLTDTSSEQKLFLQTPIIVNHASSKFDKNFEARDGINSLIEVFSERSDSFPVIHLKREMESNSWYTDHSPDYTKYSYGGENKIVSTTGHVIISGGYFGNTKGGAGCLTNAMEHLIHNYYNAFPLKVEFNIHLVIPSIYYYNDFWGDEEDNNYKEMALINEMESTKPSPLSIIPSLFQYDEEFSQSEIGGSNLMFNYPALSFENSSRWEISASWGSPMRTRTPLSLFRVEAIYEGKIIEKI